MNRTVSAVTWLALCITAGCAQEDEIFIGTFDSPSTIAVLPAAEGGPFTHDVGFAPSRHGGRVRLLDLPGYRYLSTSTTASFLPTNALPTGRNRVLTQAAPVVTGEDKVDLFLLDQHFGQVLKAPVVDGRTSDGSLRRIQPELTSWSFEDVDGSGDDIILYQAEPSLNGGASETWTVTRRSDAQWTVSGSRSGKQNGLALPNRTYTTDDASVSFTFGGTKGSEGDTLTFVVDNGLQELDLGLGEDDRPAAIAASPDSSVVLLAVEGVQSTLYALDPVTSEPTATFDLGAGGVPSRFSWNSEGSVAYLADASPLQGSVWAYDATSGQVEQYAMPFPVKDVASLGSGDSEILYVSRADTSEVWLYEISTGEFIDVNSISPGVQGMPFSVPVRGLAAIHLPYSWLERTSNDSPIVGTSVAVSLNDGQVVYMKEGTGCLLLGGLGSDGFVGPRSVLEASGGIFRDWAASFTIDQLSNPWLERNENSSRHITVNSCSGIAPGERWIVRYDAAFGAWEVEGRRSGIQETLALEEQRYVSDNGQVSFFLHSGTDLSIEPYTFSFVVNPGFVSNLTNPNPNIDQPVINEPGRPAVFTALDRDGNPEPRVVVASEASDFLTILDVTEGWISYQWR